MWINFQSTRGFQGALTQTGLRRDRASAADGLRLNMENRWSAAFDVPLPGMLALARIQLLTHSAQTRLLLRETLPVAGWNTVKDLNFAGTHPSNLANVSCRYFKRQRCAPVKRTIVYHQSPTE
jgi:hypothetical protein